MSRSWVVAALSVLAMLVVAAPAAAQLPIPTVPGVTGGGGPAPQPYGTGDAGGFLDILPPGTNGTDNAPQLAQFLATKQRPPHSEDQRDRYANLVRFAPNITQQDLLGFKFFKDATFGVRPADAERTYSPRSDVTIVRDQFGVPHIYGSTRAGTMFGTGYAAAEDRLFFIDVLRHLGRGQLSSFAGGAPGNRAMDSQQWAVAPYTEDDLNRQITQGAAALGPDGVTLEDDAKQYVAGINQYIAEARLNPLKMPAEYGAILRPQGPDDFQLADLVSIASLVGGIFGKGGGKELPWAQLLQGFQQRLGDAAGLRAFDDFRDPDDPEAPTTIHDGTHFAYRTMPAQVAPGSVAMPDPGSVTYVADVVGGAGSRGGGQAAMAKKATAPSGGLLAFPKSNSNALVVSGAHTTSGHPIAVFGPQVGYFAPQILMEEDVHGPGIDATGAAFPGVNFYVELGHGRDYAWSATSAGQDIIDTFALPLCNPSGGAVAKDATTYEFRGRCEQMETLTRTNTWTPNAADQTPPGSETLTALRTKLGIVVARATVGGRPVVYTQLRSTYLHEIDSALGFRDLNDPARVASAADFQRAVSRIGYTFNWFYADAKHIAYFNSGNNPVRAPNLDPRLPAWGTFEWQGWNPDTYTATYTPPEQHPQIVDQDYLTSWNNKQAPGFAAPDTDTPFTSIFRSQTLDRRVQAAIADGRKVSVPGLVNAMGDAGTVDVRGAYVLPYLIRVMRSGPTGTRARARAHRRHARHRRRARRRRVPAFTGRVNRARAAQAALADPQVQSALATLDAWAADGAHRRDLDGDGNYEHSDAIRTMDAWWPLLVKAQFGPTLGGDLLDSLENTDEIDNTPNSGGSHLGSAWDVGFYGTVQKDLRRVLGRKVAGPLSRGYCGGGSLAGCQQALATSLKEALAVPASKLYHDATCAKANSDGSQTCFDAISFRALGGITQPLIPWINRPTFQQVVEVKGGR